MRIFKAIFAGSSTRVEQQTARRLPEFAFIGRSNVGKSSLINMLCGNAKLAMTSGTPGKTRLINHFLVNDSWYLVDLPGYGYAKASDAERKKIRMIIDNYINLSPDLVNLFVLIDSRHEIGKIDLDFLVELGSRRIPFSIIFTKADKLGPNALKARIEQNHKQLLEFWEELPPCFVSSSEDRTGREEILDYIGSVLDSLNATQAGQSDSSEPKEKNQ